MSDEDTPFATPDDLAARWHPLTVDEKKQAEALLADASDLIRSQCPGWKDASEATLRRICCQVVKTAMAGQAGAGITQQTGTVGPFSESYSYANPAGELYLTRAQKHDLGANRQTCTSWTLGGG